MDGWEFDLQLRCDQGAFDTSQEQLDGLDSDFFQIFPCQAAFHKEYSRELEKEEMPFHPYKRAGNANVPKKIRKKQKKQTKLKNWGNQEVWKEKKQESYFEP